MNSIGRDHRKSPDYSFDTKDYTAITCGVANEGAQTGTEYRPTALNQGPGLGALPKGTLIIKDIFFKNNRTYVGQYVQFPSTEKEGPVQNQQQAFRTLIAHGLQFK